MRTCLECKNFHYSEGCHAYSEVTPGDDPRMACDATPAHWYFSFMDSDINELRKCLFAAEGCQDFAPISHDFDTSKAKPTHSDLHIIARGKLGFTDHEA